MSPDPLKNLLVEDDNDDAFYFKELINDGIPDPTPTVDHPLTFNEAISRLEQTSYDLCMFDFRLGEVDGIDLLRTVRSKQITVPIILLTGHGNQEIAVEAMKAGATDYLSKEKLSVESLSHAIRYVLQLHSESQRRRQAETALKKSHEEITQARRELQESMGKLQTAQDQILRSEKLAGIGRLAAGICHEILNPLNIISGHSQALLMERSDDPALAEDLTSMMEEIHRIEKIINGLLKFSRRGEVELKKVNINQELDSVLAIMEKDMALDGISIVRDFDSSISQALIDPDRMRQVFLNILSNAKYAMKSGGVLTVSTQTYPQNAPGDDSKDGKILRIRFTDSGDGISKEDLGKIFDPFFTTKPEDKGTGLGLTVCYTIVEKHGGTLEVESTLGKGSTFTIALPIKQKTDDILFFDEAS